MQLLSLVASQLLRTAVLVATSLTTKLQGWSVGVQFLKDILVYHGLFSPASGERSQGRSLGFSIWSGVDR